MNIRSIQRQLTVIALVALCTFGLASVAQAVDLTIGDARYLGSVDPGQPANEAAEAGYINHLISLPLGTVDDVFGGQTYDRSNNTCGGPCPTATATGAAKTEGGINAINFGTGWQYLLAKYGNGPDHIWWVGGLTGTGHTIPANLGPSLGLSHFTLFNPGGTTVPEPNSLLLLGSAITILGAARRWFRN